MDFGGVGPGCEDSIISLFGSLIEQIQEKPNCLFVIYSTFTQRWYENAIQKYAPELEAPNVVYWSAENCFDRLKQWVDCDEFKIQEPQPKGKLTTPARGLINT